MSIRQLGEELEKRGILTVAIEPDRIRFTTNKEVNRADIETTLQQVKDLLG